MHLQHHKQKDWSFNPYNHKMQQNRNGNKWVKSITKAILYKIPLNRAQHIYDQLASKTRVQIPKPMQHLSFTSIYYTLYLPSHYTHITFHATMNQITLYQHHCDNNTDTHTFWSTAMKENKQVAGYQKVMPWNNLEI